MGIAVDGASGAIVTGYFSGDVSFGSASLASRSNYDAFVMHVTASGTIDWAVQAGGTLKDQGLGIAGDDAGGALVTGYFSDRASFGSTSLTSRGDYDVFVMHVAASGAIDWSVQAGGVARDQGSGIAHDGAGGAFVTGFFSSDASFGSVKLTSRGDGEYDIFVMHVIKSGAIDWAVQAGGTAIDEGYGIAYDGTGGALVTGTFGGDASFGSISLTSRGTFDAFVMHVTASGAIDWAVQVGGTAEVKGSSIAHDGVGGAFVTGYFMGDAVFGLTALHSQGHSDAFVMHLTASGTIDWAVQLGGTAEVKGNGIARYGAGGALVTGFFSENLVFGLKTLNSRGGANMFVMRVTDSGAIDWAVQAGGMSMVRGQGIAHDGDVLEGRGSLVVGYFSGVVSFGSTSLRSRGALDVFVMHVAKSGAIDWAVQAGGTLDDTGLGIAHDSAGGALVTGTFHGDAWFGSTLLKSRGGYERVRSDVFVMHVTASGTIDWAIQAGGTSIDHVSGIAYDGVGGALVTGGFSGDAWFGSTSLTSRGEFDVFVMHVTASGTIDWAVQAGGSYSDEGLGIAYDGAGGALVTGHFCGDASFGSSSFASRGVFDVFVMHVTKSGAIDWAVQAGGDLDDKGHGIAHDGAGGSLVTGYFQGASSFGSTSLTSRGMYDAFVMHVAASGAIDWAVQAGGVRGGAALGSYDIAYDGAGGALVTGGFSGDAWFGSKTFHSRGEHDAFVMHVTPSGAIDWAIQAGGTANDIGYGIAHDGAGGALATGGFSGAAWFGSTSLLSRGMVDAFVMHVTASGAIDVAVQAGDNALLDISFTVCKLSDFGLASLSLNQDSIAKLRASLDGALAESATAREASRRAEHEATAELGRTVWPTQLAGLCARAIVLHVLKAAALVLELESAGTIEQLEAAALAETRRAEHTIEAERRRLADEKKSLEEALRTAQRELGQATEHVKNLEAELREALNDNSRAKRLWRAEVADTTSQAEIELTRTERAHATEVEALRRALAQASHERDDYHGQLMQLRGAHEQLHANKVSC
ncbi:pkd domain-containing protein [Chrysochromulina tobinii]|uniref:Pkd domain-containing protein n=1 Tax=Chrysochromulina tobinii TaxID=1460289 RepID=A0A0M0J7T1_9EUKA|nr:pkd domain-containing protein [Chrysochromulina tobinii]|eukprot:KOO22654.1 pkd domain-containing protein [Chrysochromulina sp. CCMP291]